MIFLLLACGPSLATDAVLRGVLVDGQRTDLAVHDGKIAALGPGVAPELPGVTVGEGRWLVPAFIDSHVHLAYRDDPAALGDGGIAAAVDLAAPIDQVGRAAPPLQVIWSGPMVTAEHGYPLQSWGRDGYGWPAPDVASAIAAVDLVVAAGARVVKLPVTGPPVLDAASLKAAADAAHGHGVPVVAHALGADEAARAAEAGADILGHVPVEPLPPEVVAMWAKRAVIPTLAAFGGTAAAVENLRALRAAGATVLYGTDFGNTRESGISCPELRLMIAAGMDGAAILAAGTTAPAARWGFTDLGTLAPGKAASFLIVTQDPRVNPEILCSPEQVWISGVRRR